MASFVTFEVKATELIVSDNLVIREIDNKPIDNTFFSKQQTIDLVSGNHVIVLKYKDVFEDIEFAEDRLVKSDYFVVKFNVKNQQSVSLSTIAISNLAEAERFAKTPELQMLDENKVPLVLSLEKLSDYELAQQVSKVVKTLSVPVVTPQEGFNNEFSNQEAQNFNNKVMDNVEIVPMLQYWWNKANNEEKSAFIEYINKK